VLLVEALLESYRPILDEIARIQASAALDEEELKNKGGINMADGRHRR
jgi:hypothetical protein